MDLAAFLVLCSRGAEMQHSRRGNVRRPRGGRAVGKDKDLRGERHNMHRRHKMSNMVIIRTYVVV